MVEDPADTRGAPTPKIKAPVSPGGWPHLLFGIPGVSYRDGVVTMPVQAGQAEVLNFFAPLVADYDINLMHALMNTLDASTGGTGILYPAPTLPAFLDGTTGPWYTVGPPLQTLQAPSLPRGWVREGSVAENAYIDVLARISGGFLMGAVGWQLSQSGTAHSSQYPRSTATRLMQRLRLCHGTSPFVPGAWRTGRWFARDSLNTLRPALVTRLAFASSSNPWNKLLTALTPAGTPLGTVLGTSSPEPIPMPLQWDEAVVSGIAINGPGTLSTDPFRLSFVLEEVAEQLGNIGDSLVTIGAVAAPGLDKNLEALTGLKRFVDILLAVALWEVDEDAYEVLAQILEIGVALQAMGRENLFVNHALAIPLDLVARGQLDAIALVGSTLSIDLLLEELFRLSKDEMEAIVSCLITTDDGAFTKKKNGDIEPLESTYWATRIEDLGLHPEPVVLLSDKLARYGVLFGATQMPPVMVYNFCPWLILGAFATTLGTSLLPYWYRFPSLVAQTLPALSFFTTAPPTPLSVAPAQQIAADTWAQWWSDAQPTYKAALVLDGAAEILWQTAVLDDGALAASGFLASDGLVGAWIRRAARVQGLGTIVNGIAGISIGEILRYTIRQLLTDLFLETMTNHAVAPNIDLEPAHQIFCWMNTTTKRTSIDRALGPMVGVANSEVVLAMFDCAPAPVRAPRTLRVRSSVATILLGMPVLGTQGSALGRLWAAFSGGQTVSSCDIALLRRWVREAREACLLDLEEKLRPDFTFQDLQAHDADKGELPAFEPTIEDWGTL